jgi:hypothetical protein
MDVFRSLANVSTKCKITAPICSNVGETTTKRFSLPLSYILPFSFYRTYSLLYHHFFIGVLSALNASPILLSLEKDREQAPPSIPFLLVRRADGYIYIGNGYAPLQKNLLRSTIR